MVAGVLSDLVGGVSEFVIETALQEERGAAVSGVFRRCTALTKAGMLGNTKTLETDF